MEAQPRGHFIRTKDLVAELGLSRTSIWREVKAGRLPKPVSLSTQRKGWWSHDVDAWKQARLRESRQS